MKQFLAICTLLTFVGGNLYAGDTPEQATIRTLIEQAYIHGAFNEQNTTAMEAGFHGEFAIFSAKGTKLGRYPIDSWISGIKKKKASDDYDPTRAKMDYKISQIDVTGGAAAAKVELSRDGMLIYTDYLSFLRFEDGWKIAAKVYHHHKK